MSTLWARIEPLLARVQKPARYIGCEDGAVTPEADLIGRSDVVEWLLAYPDTYEIGLPNQGLQILFEILNERNDAVAERTYAPWSDMNDEMRAAGVPLFSVDHHRSAEEFDLLAFNLSSELVYTNVLNMIDLAGAPVRAADRGDDDLIVIVGGHAAFNPEPLADFIDAAVLGEGEEVVSDITDVVRDWKLAGRARPSRFPQRAVEDPGRLRAVDVRGHLRRGAHRRDRTPVGRRTRDRRQANGRRPGRVAVPEEPDRSAHRSGARSLERRGVPWLHPWLPILSGGHDHAAGPRAAR